jgi:hypothetical protein
VFVRFDDRVVRYYIPDYSEKALFSIASTFTHDALIEALKDDAKSAFGGYLVFWKDEQWELFDATNQDKFIALTTATTSTRDTR